MAQHSTNANGGAISSSASAVQASSQASYPDDLHNDDPDVIAAVQQMEMFFGMLAE